MDKKSDIIACVSWVAFAVPCVWSLRWEWLCLVPLALQTLTYLLERRRSLIAFGASILPAGVAFLGLRLCNLWCLAGSGLVALAFIVAFCTFIPATTPRTDRWVGVLVILEALAFILLTAFAL